MCIVSHQKLQQEWQAELTKFKDAATAREKELEDSIVELKSQVQQQGMCVARFLRTTVVGC